MERIAIVDDDRVFNRKIRSIVERVVSDFHICVEMMCFYEARTLLYELEDGGDFDIYLLDIELPEMNGMELARKIRETNQNAVLIFVTSYSKFAIEGYDVNAYQYIMKENVEKKLPMVLTEIVKRKYSEDESEFYRIETNFRQEKFKIRDIVRFYKEEKNVKFVTKDKIYQQRISVAEVLDKLSKDEFVPITRGNVVNLRFVRGLGKFEVRLENGECLKVSQANLANLKKQITEYWSRQI